MTDVEKYIEITKQSPIDIFAGERQYGPKYVNDLITKALQEKKKLVFITDLIEDQDLGLGHYELQPL